MDKNKRSVDEIAQMRRIIDRLWGLERGNMGGGFCYNAEDRAAQVEQRLKTHLSNGTSLAELSAMVEEIYTQHRDKLYSAFCTLIDGVWINDDSGEPCFLTSSVCGFKAVNGDKYNYINSQISYGDGWIMGEFGSFDSKPKSGKYDFIPYDPFAKSPSKKLRIKTGNNSIYMDGIGVMDKTRELNDKMFDKLPIAFIGGCVAILVPNMIRFSHSGTVANIGCVLAVVVGIILIWPWIDAGNKVSAHSKAMKAETKKRGKGWAKS